MTGNAIPDSDHVAHYLGWEKTNKDKGAPVPAREGFLPRYQKGEDYVSANWLEYFRDDRSDFADLVARVRVAMDAKPNLRLGRNGYLAILNAGRARRAIAQVLGPGVLRIEKRPEDDDKSHAGILGFQGGPAPSERDLRIADTLGLVAEMHAAVVRSPIATPHGVATSA